METIEEIKKLKVLLDQGAISEDEFNLLKKRILSQESDFNETQKQPLSHIEDTGNVNKGLTKTLHKKIGCFSLIVIVIIISIIYSFFKVDIKDEKAVIKHMQGTWIGNDHENGLYTHYKLEISGNNFKGWLQTASTDDEPSWTPNPDEKGTFSLSPVQGYTDSSDKYRNINFEKEGGGYGDNSLMARAFTKMIIYDDNSGLYVVGWASMKKK